MSRPLLSLCLAAALIGLGGCATVRPGAETASETAAIKLGANLVGEACRAEPRKGVVGEPGTPQPIDIFCGKSKRPTGGLVASYLPLELPDAPDARRTTIERNAAASATGRETASRLACGAGRWAQEEIGEFLVSPCVARSGNWPHITVVAAVGKILFQGEGLPADLPAVEAAINILSGKEIADRPAAPQDPAAALKRVENASGGQFALFGSDDFDRYEELTRTARLYNSAKKYAESETAYRRALEIQTRIFGADAPGVGDTVMHLALEVSNQGRFDEAAALFRRADPIVQRSPDAADRAVFFSYQAYDAANQGRGGGARGGRRDATSLRRSLLPPTPLAEDSGGFTPVAALRGEIAHSLTTEAVMALRSDDVAGAESATNEALTILVETPGLPPWWRADALMAMAEVNAQRGRMIFAERNFRDALTIRQQLFGETAPVAITYMRLGRTYAREELYRQAVQAYRAAFKILANEDVARADLVFDQIAPFIDAALELAKKDPAQRAQLEGEIFQAMQLTATGVADQTIARTSARLASNDPAMGELVRALQEAERKRDSNRMELANETAKPDERRGAAREEALAREFRTASLEVDEINRKLRDSYPGFAKLAKSGEVDLAAVQKALRPGEAVVAFQFTREAGYGVLVSPDGVSAARLTLDERELRQLVGELRQAVVPRAGGIEDFDLKAANSLYRKLFGPLNPDFTKLRHLVVAPTGALASLPLAVLVTEPSPPRDYAKAAWLIRKVALSQVPSIRAFIALRGEAGRSAAPQPFFGVGNPTFEGRAERTGPGAPPSSLDALSAACRDGGPVAPALIRALSPLPETESEVGTIARLLGAGAGSTLTGAAATEPALRERRLDQYRVLYFATHGLLPGELRCQSEPAIALSPPRAPVQDKAADGLLDASEIAALRLDADLVVLSACNTASGGGKFGGEALSGLAEAFFYAGARSLVASHWPVPSAPTVRLMTGIFERSGLDRGRGTAAALQQSQLGLAGQPATAHPFFWAAFTLIGDGAGSASLVAAATDAPVR